MVYTSDELGRRAVLQVVGRRVDISIGEEWGHAALGTQIVAIGAAGRIDASLLEETARLLYVVRSRGLVIIGLRCDDATHALDASKQQS